MCRKSGLLKILEPIRIRRARREERRGNAGGRIVEFLVNPQHPPPPEFRRNRRGIKRSVAPARTKHREDILLATCGPTRQAPGCVQTNSKGSSHLFPFPVLYSWATRQGLPFEEWFAQPSTHYATVTPSSQTCRSLNFIECSMERGSNVGSKRWKCKGYSRLSDDSFRRF